MANDHIRRIAVRVRGQLDIAACQALFAKHDFEIAGHFPDLDFTIKGPVNYLGNGLLADVDAVFIGVILISSIQAVTLAFGGRAILMASLETSQAEMLALLGEGGQSQAPAPNAARDKLHKTLDMEIKETGWSFNTIKAFIRHELKYVGEVVEKISSYTSLEAYGILTTIPKNKLERWLHQHDLDFGMDTMGWMPPDHPSRTGVHA